MKHTFTLPAAFLVVGEKKTGQNCSWRRAAEVTGGHLSWWAEVGLESESVAMLTHCHRYINSRLKCQPPLSTHAAETLVRVQWLLVVPILT